MLRGRLSLRCVRQASSCRQAATWCSQQGQEFGGQLTQLVAKRNLSFLSVDIDTDRMIMCAKLVSLIKALIKRKLLKSARK